MPLIDEDYISELKASLRKQNQSKGLEAEEAQSDEIYKKILRLTSHRERSSQELRDRFKKELFDESDIEQAIERALVSGVVDDMRFAEALIRTRLNSGKGSQGIERELEKNGINVFDVPGWPESFLESETYEIEQAMKLLDRRPPTAKNKRDAAYRRLISKGYSSSVASTAARQWVDSLEYM